jgi:hypothetical protein
MPHIHLPFEVYRFSPKASAGLGNAADDYGQKNADIGNSSPHVDASPGDSGNVDVLAARRL